MTASAAAWPNATAWEAESTESPESQEPLGFPPPGADAASGCQWQQLRTPLIEHLGWASFPQEI